MKKIFIVLAICLCLTGCYSSGLKTNGFETDNNGNSVSSMFVIVEKQPDFYVMYHKETKVMYVVSSAGKSYGVLTLLVDQEGKPLLWEGE